MKVQLKRLWRSRHFWMGWAWLVLAIPALLWWKESILFVILMSIYANAEASFAAHKAQKAEENGHSSSED